MTEKPFLIYRSSAGSGKTYTLAYSYLKLALRDINKFRQILGVTFTNKATAEMKSRIVDVLCKLSEGQEHSMKRDLLVDLQISDQELMARSKKLLSSILHQYGQFSVSTIDSFFHQVIRNFAREIGLQGSFSITLESDLVLNMVVDDLLSDIGEDSLKQVKGWLTEFAGNLVEEGSSWDFRSSIYKLADQLLREEFKEFDEQILSLTPNDFYEVQVGLTKTKKQFEHRLRQLGEEGLELLDQAGGIDHFKKKKSGPAGMFLKAAKGESDVSATRWKAKDHPAEWLTQKQFLSEVQLINALEEGILPKYNQLLEHIETQLLGYKSAEAASRYIYTLGILAIISRYLQRYRDENDVMLVPDLTDFLRKIIRDSDTPFIYEKIGTRYHHFLLDEFQDTSHFQWDNFRPLIKNAVSGGSQSLVVGDVKQSIYRWRGGDWDLLHSKLQEDLEGFAQVKNLSSNFRSAHEIVHFNNSFFNDLMEVQHEFFSGMDESFTPLLERIKEVYSDISQKAESENDGGLIEIDFLSDTEEWKSKAISLLINQVEQLQREGHNLSEMAILTRTTSEGRQVADAFFRYRQSPSADANLSYEVISSEALQLESHPVVKFLLSMLTWLHDEKDQIVLTEWLVHYCEVSHKPFPDDLSDWEKFVPEDFIAQRSSLKRLPIYEIVEMLIRFFDLQNNKGSYAYLQGFQDAVLDFSKNEKGDIGTFLEWWEKTGAKRSIQLSEETDAIRILTIHKAKGLEFPIVFVPFLNWKLDSSSGLKENIIWCKPPAKAPFNLLPVIPLKYVSELKETYWAKDYWKERLDNYLDSINLLYVAFTRPVNALYVYAPETSSKGNVLHVGDVAHRLVSKHECFSIDDNQFRKGTLKPCRNQISNIREKALANYNSYPWRSRVSLQLKSRNMDREDYNKFDPLDPRMRGIRLHELISKIHSLDDLQRFSEDPLFDEVEELISQGSVTEYFKDVEEVRTEPTILLPNGEMRRLDRLLRKKGVWYVLDFKSGKPRKSDHQQVAGYLEVLSDMGFQDARGRLIYLDPLKVEEVKI